MANQQWLFGAYAMYMRRMFSPWIPFRPLFLFSGEPISERVTLVDLSKPARRLFDGKDLMTAIERLDQMGILANIDQALRDEVCLRDDTL